MKAILPLLIAILLLACQNQPIDDFEYVPETPESEILGQYLDLSKLDVDHSTYREFWNPPFVNRKFSITVDKDQVTLGRVLFYDKNLSADGTVSCASCHQQHLAFADSSVFSQGINGHLTERNSFALGSFLSFSGYYANTADSTRPLPRFFWDNRAASIKEQLQETIANPHEMGMNPEALPAKLGQLPYYQILNNRINSGQGWDESPERIFHTLEAFMGSLFSNYSPFDEELKRMTSPPFDKAYFLQDFAGFTPSENIGKNLFFANCASCHGRFLGFEADRVFNQLKGNEACNGLDANYSDKGVGKVMQESSMDGFFKIPSIKNIAVTAPYMHDGRFATLREVIEFYNDEVQPHGNLDPLLKDELGNPKRLNLSEKEMAALEDFLHTLTDHRILTDDKWSDPFLSK